MKRIIFAITLISLFSPAYSVTTKMFRVLDTCARYRLNELDVFQTIEKLKLEYKEKNKIEAKAIVKSYCSVFTPNEKIEF